MVLNKGVSIYCMKYNNVLKQLGANALFWTGIVAIILTFLQGNTYFLLFFAGLVIFNFAIIILIEKLAPNLLKIEAIQEQPGLVFKLKPVKYPKVLDEEKREYLPEFIHLDIANDKRVIFAGDLARTALKNLRDSLDQVLSTQEAKTTTVQRKTKKKISS